MCSSKAPSAKQDSNYRTVSKNRSFLNGRIPTVFVFDAPCYYDQRVDVFSCLSVSKITEKSLSRSQNQWTEKIRLGSRNSGFWLLSSFGNSLIIEHFCHKNETNGDTNTSPDIKLAGSDN